MSAYPSLPARRIRNDGWTVARQDAFLKALAACGCVTDAARSVGMSRQSALDLRRAAPHFLPGRASRRVPPLRHPPHHVPAALPPPAALRFAARSPAPFSAAASSTRL